MGVTPRPYRHAFDGGGEGFTERLHAGRLAWLDYLELSLAISLAAGAHAGQFDKAGEPYLWHVLRVGASLLPDLDAARVGILHDVREDCPQVTGEQIWSGLANDSELMPVLELLTRKPGQAYEDYILALSVDPLARKVKVADLRDNLDPRRLALAIEKIGPDKIGTLTARYRQALVTLGAE